MTDNEKKINNLKYIFSQTLEITQTTTMRTKTFHRYSSMVKPRGITSFIGRFNNSIKGRSASSHARILRD